MPVIEENKLLELADKHIKAVRSPLTREDNYEEWVEERWKRIGSSTIAKVIGLSKYTSPRKVWQEYKTKTNSFKENPFSRMGLYTEEPIMLEAEAQNPQYTIYPLNWTYYNEEFPVASATPDGLVKKKGRKDYGLNETKFTSAKVDLVTWNSGGVPAWVYAQLQWQLGVCGLNWGIVTAMVQGSPLIKVVEVEFDEEVFGNMYSAAERFMASLEQDSPPNFTGSDSDKQLADEMLSKSGVYNPEEEKELSKELELQITSLINLNNKIRDCNKEIKELKSEKNKIESSLKDFSNGAGVLKDTLGRKVIINRVERGEYVSKASTYFSVKVKEAKGE